MKTLSGECSHLLLRRSEDLNSLIVELVNSTEDAILKWDWTTRSSPIFSFRECIYTKWNRAPHVLVFFIGPLDPAAWTIDVQSYCTLGTYNLIAIFDPDSPSLAAAYEYFRKNPEINYEVWELKSGKVMRQAFFGPRISAGPTKVRRAKVAAGLASAEEENCTLFAAAIGKASRYMPAVARDLEVFEDDFRRRIEAKNGEGDNTKLSWLVNVNAALSRFTSQTFSGVSPIAATECHFWSHSLLGVGLATQALVNIRRFTETAVGNVDWIDLLDELSATPVPSNWRPLFHRVAANAAEWFDAESVMEEALSSRQALISSREQNNQRLPLIVCFSGRDGFRSTSLTLSAPLEVISACNAYGWSPVTLSHEICHVWMSGILGTIFPDPSDRVATQHMSDVVQYKNISSVLDDLRIAVYFCYTLLERERLGIGNDEELPDVPWLEVVETHRLEVNELLTHVLDFQFFYHQDETRYVNSIWSSWDVIPNIKERLQSYIIRSSCSLLSMNISHEGAIDKTLDRLEQLLVEVRADMGHANYVDDALEILRTDRSVLKVKIQRREMLVRLAKLFFTNRTIAARLDREMQETGGVYKSLTPGVFDNGQIWNPMRFLGHHCKDRQADRAKALWLIGKVAFMQAPDETFKPS